MITSNTKPPKIRHSKVDLREKAKLTGVLNHFFKSVLVPSAHRKQREGLAGWDDPDNLLALRKQLVASVKKGMLDREDQEEEIALLAVFVWFTRLNEERRRSIIGAWDY